jgi:transposase InsO family protein
MPTTVKALKGVSGQKQAISQFILLPLQLTSGQKVETPCAVISDLPCIALFGLPFLYQIQATHDIQNQLLTTPMGPIPLIHSPNPPQTTSCQSVVLDPNTTVEIDLSTSALDDNQRSQLLELLREYDDLWRSGRRGKAVVVAHRIQLLTDRPVVARPRQTTEEQQKVINEEVDKMLKDGVIQPSCSPYASEIVMVPKKSGEWRFCIDYRALNKITIKDKYPLPRISELIRSIKDSKYFVALDLRAGYWQIPMASDAIKYTAFRCFQGLYEFVLMPFGLTNAPATFQRVMDFLFSDLRFKGVLAYLDDILVHGNTFEETLQLLRKVFYRLRAANLTLNLPKSHFFPRKLRYLGQLIENGHIIPDPERIKVLRRIKLPATIHEVRSLLGTIGVYNRFIKDYAATLSPIFDLLKDHKNTKRNNLNTAITWMPIHQEALQCAISQVETAVLAIPLDSDKYLVETDASDKAIGAILNVEHNGRWEPVEFFSKNLSKTEQNWPVREKEAYAIVRAFQKFDCYLRGRKFVVHTDHQSLQWMLDSLKARISRWVSLLSEYTPEVFYKKGSELVHVDFFSRYINNDDDDILQDRMVYFTTVSDLPSLQDILKAQNNVSMPGGKGFAKKDDVIYYHGRIWVPLTSRISVIAACHSIAPYHHPGVKRTRATIMKVFNWPGIHEDVVQYIRSCIYCQRARSGKERLQGYFRTHPIPGAFETVYMDFWQCSYEKQHYLVLTMIDQLTKWAECIPLPNKDATTTARAFLKSWVYRFGVPKTLVTDNDKTFTSALLKSLSAKLGINRLTATVYHPEGNAVIESFHKTLSTGFRHLYQEALPFDEALEMILFGYRSTLHTTTANTPAYLTYGKDLRLAPDIDWRMEPDVTTQERLKFLSTLRLDVQLQALRALSRQNMTKNQHRRPVQFDEGQLVLVRALPIDQLKYKVSFYKAVPRWSLPYRVIQIFPGGKKAVVRCLLTSASREVHIQDVQFILPPQGEAQVAEWLKLARIQAESMYNPTTCKAKIDEFFQQITMPQVPATLSRAKRPRSGEVLGGA